MLCEVGSRGPGPVSGVELLDLALLAPASLHLTPSKATALVMVRAVMCDRLELASDMALPMLGG